MAPTAIGTLSGPALGVADAVGDEGAIGLATTAALGLGDATPMDGPGTHPAVKAATISDAT
ncbi:MAG TPA: hypothetical protein VIN37_04660 [Candidatus Limnocylindria bacterium]